MKYRLPQWNVAVGAGLYVRLQAYLEENPAECRSKLIRAAVEAYLDSKAKRGKRA
jgi:metal-responsive CopG/Arc/MetJ family transcriptional regulator